MIDIVVGNNEVVVENKNYNSFNKKEVMAKLLLDIIERCLYSGESIILRVDHIDHVEVVQEWVNTHVSSRYQRMKP